MLNRKSIVLSDIKNDSERKAVLSLQEDELGVCGTVRLYNFSHELDGICSLGIYVNNKVYKAGLTLKSRMLYEFFVNLEHIPQKFSVAIINIQNAIPTPILYGSSDGNNDDIYASIISEISGKVNFENTKNVLDKYGVDFDEEDKKEIEKEIDQSLCENNCADCVYKKFFFENSADVKSEKLSKNDDMIVEQPPEDAVKEPDESMVGHETETNESEVNEVIFFEKLKPQIDKLFEKNPIEDNLQNLIPSSKWVKVEYEDDGDFFVFGLLYDENENVKYVCYGVPAVFEEEPPKELAGYPIWLPLNRKEGFGYWLTYQDAITGEPVKAVID